MTGFAIPISTGPITSAPPSRQSSLYPMLPLFSSGKMSTLASPVSRAKGNSVSRTERTTAGSTCISPSTSRSGRRARTSSTARRTLAGEPSRSVPKFEYESMAMRGLSSKALASSAVEMAMSASSSALGSALTVQSASRRKLSLKARMYVPDARRPSCVRMISSEGRIASG